MSFDLLITINQRPFTVRMSKPGLVEVNGHLWNVEFVELNNGHAVLRLNNRVFDVSFRRTLEPSPNSFPNSPLLLQVNNREYVASVDDSRSLLLKSLMNEESEKGGSTVVTSPMPGLVVKVEVREGDEVIPGQGLVVLEAMKMENELKASGKGKVTSVHVREGRSVEKGEALVTIELTQGNS
jgi:biotin carboxyl carrier protein